LATLRTLESVPCPVQNISSCLCLRLFKCFHDLLAVRWMKKRVLNYKIAGRVN
jgi:hypothetical protein